MRRRGRFGLLMTALLVLSQIMTVCAKENEETIKIVVPTELPFMITQMSTEERNIISGDFDFINYGNVDVEFLIQDIRCLFGKEEEYVQAATPAAISKDSLKKELFMYFEKADITMEENGNGFIRTFKRADWTVISKSGDSEEQVLTDRLKERTAEIAVLDENDVVITTGGAVSYKVVLKAAQYEDGKFVRLNPESIFSFRLAGFVNPNPAVVWNSNDIKLQFLYSWSKLKQEEPLKAQDIPVSAEIQNALDSSRQLEKLADMPFTGDGEEREESSLFPKIEEDLPYENPAGNGDRRK